MLNVFLTSIAPHMEALKTVNFGSKLYTKLYQSYPALYGYANENRIKQKGSNNKLPETSERGSPNMYNNMKHMQNKNKSQTTNINGKL